MIDWLNNLSGGQVTLLALLLCAVVFFPGYYITMAVLNRYGDRAVPHVMAIAGACVVGIAVLVAILVIRS